MPSEWSLSYPRYMIDDGCTHVAAGQVLKWIVEFWTEGAIGFSAEKVRTASEVGDHKYRITGEVVYLSDTASVIDFGLRAISSRDILPRNSKQGDFVSGEVRLGLPLCTEVIPEEILASLEYEWEVETVLADLTPYVEVSGQSGGRVFYRDGSQPKYQEVKSTDAVHAEAYILRCLSRPFGHL